MKVTTFLKSAPAWKLAIIFSIPFWIVDMVNLFIVTFGGSIVTWSPYTMIFMIPGTILYVVFFAMWAGIHSSNTTVVIALDVVAWYLLMLCVAKILRKRKPVL